MDGSGQPATITVLSDEFLRVTYEVRKYLPDPVDNVQIDFPISGINYDITTRPSSVNSASRSWANTFISPIGYGSGVRAGGGSITGISVNEQSLSNASRSSFVEYSGDEHGMAIEAVWDPGVVTGDVGRILWGRPSSSTSSPWHTYAQWQTGFNPPIQKSDDDRLTLQVYAEWGRA